MKSLVILLLTSSMLLVNLHATAANHHAYSYHPEEAKEDLHFLPKDNNHGLAKQAIAGHGLYQQSPSDIHLKIGTQQYPQENTVEHHYQHPHRPAYHSLHYNNVAQHLDNENNAADDDDGELDIVYHHTNKQSMESTQQEKPTLLDQLKSQAQDLSEGYATFLQIQENDSYTDDNSPQQQQREQQQHHYHYGKEPHRQQAAVQLANPQQLHYQKLQQQLHLYYQQLQQQEEEEEQQQQLQQQHASVHGHSLRQETQIAYQQQQHRQPQQQQQPLATTYITPSIESPNINLSPPPTTTPRPYTTSPQATVQPNLHHQRQRQPAIVSHATGNEASPHLQRPPHQANSRPHYQPGTAPKFGNHIARQPAVVYGPPSPPLTLSPPLGPRHSKQVIYAPMRFVNDRQLPYSAKTFPYPPSFITLTTTERPMGPKLINYPNHKSAYQKIPDFFVNRSSKSLLDSYIPSWQVVKMLEEYRQGQQRNSNLQTLALPYHRNFKRNADNVQGKVKS